MKLLVLWKYVNTAALEVFWNWFQSTSINLKSSINIKPRKTSFVKNYFRLTVTPWNSKMIRTAITVQLSFYELISYFILERIQLLEKKEEDIRYSLVLLRNLFSSSTLSLRTQYCQEKYQTFALLLAADEKRLLSDLGR